MSASRAGSGPRRLALLCQHFYPEMVSTGMHMTELATRLAERGWEITVYCARPSWDSEGDDGQPTPRRLHHEGVDVIRVRTVGSQRAGLASRGLFAVTFVLAVAWAILRDRSEYDGVIVTTNPPFLGLIAWGTGRLFGLPYMLIVYDVYPDIAVRLGILSPRSPLTRGWSLITRTIFNGAATIVVIGRDMAEIVRQKIPVGSHGRMCLIPNWSDERRVHPVGHPSNTFRQRSAPTGHFVVQYSGRLGRTHNVEVLVEAARLLRGSNVLFQFIGDGAKRSALASIAKEVGADNVVFAPHQPIESLSEVLSAADLAVVCLERGFAGLSVPSKTYGIMAVGRPILGLLEPDSEIGRTIEETGCGVILSDPSGSSIAAIIRDLAASGARLRAMGAAGRRAFLGRYTLERAAWEYDRALTKMLEAPGLSTQTAGRVGDLWGRVGVRSALAPPADRSYVAVAVRRTWLLLLCALVSGAVAFAATRGQPATYQARATLVVGDSLQSTNPDPLQVQGDQELASTFADLAARRIVLQGTVAALGLPGGWERLRPHVTATAVPDTSLVEITVQASRPATAADIGREISRRLIQLQPTGTLAVEQARVRFLESEANDLWASIQQGQERLEALDKAASGSSGMRASRLAGEVDGLRRLIFDWRATYEDLLVMIREGSASDQLTVAEPTQADSHPLGRTHQSTVEIASLLGFALTLGVLLLSERKGVEPSPSDEAAVDRPAREIRETD